MSESPAAASPYEVLGVSPSVTDEELRRAYRLKLRQSQLTRYNSEQIFLERYDIYDSQRSSRIYKYLDLSAVCLSIEPDWISAFVHRAESDRFQRRIICSTSRSVDDHLPKVRINRTRCCCCLR